MSRLKTRGLLLAIAIACTYSTAWSDSTEFKITDYIPDKFTDFEMVYDGSLDFNPFTSSLSRARFPNLADYSVGEQDTDGFFFGSSSSMSWNYRYSSIKRFWSWDGLINGGYKYREENLSSTVSGYSEYEREQQQTDEVDARIRSYFDYSQYVSDPIYLTGGVVFSTDYAKSFPLEVRTVSENWYDTDSSRIQLIEISESSRDHSGRNVKLGMKFGLGFGHLYQGEYSASAIYIIYELREAGLLAREPSRSTMIELCKLIYYYRETSIIDSRIKKIESLQAILDFLHKTEAVSKENPFTYLIIQDVWDYFPRNDRQFGYRVELGIRQDLTHQKQRIAERRTGAKISIEYLDSAPSTGIVTREESNSFFDSSPGDNSEETSLYGTFFYSKPYSIRWQLNVSAGLIYYLDPSYVYTFGSSYDNLSDLPYAGAREDDSIDDYFRSNLISELGYIVSSRTSLWISSFFGFDTYKNEPIQSLGYLYRLSELACHAKLIYRLSRPTTLTISISGSLKHNFQRRTYNEGIREESSTISRLSFSAGMTHYLF